MDLQKLKQQHEDSIEILEFLDLLEKIESNLWETRINYVNEEPEWLRFRFQVIKRARNYAVNKYNRLNKK